MRYLLALFLSALAAAPAAAQLAPPTTNYQLAWDAVAGATRYEVRFRATDAWTPVGTAVVAPVPVLTDGPYTFAVRACGPTLCSAPATLGTQVVTPPPPEVAPPAPTNLRVAPVVTVPPPPPPPAGQGVLVRMNCAAGAAFPLCGATRTVGNDTVGRLWTRTYIAAEDAVEIAFAASNPVSEGYYGWQWSGLAAPAAGSTRVLRARIKVVSPINWGDWGAKFMVLGDVSNDSANRVISTMSLYQDRPHLNVDKNIDGRYAFGFLTPDAYAAVQIVVEPSTAGNYHFKFYVNGTLTGTSSDFAINPAQWRDFNIGYYGQFGNGGHVQIRFKDVEFADTFDPNYR